MKKALFIGLMSLLAVDCYGVGINRYPIQVENVSTASSLAV
jgi:hypothetical protein